MRLSPSAALLCARSLSRPSLLPSTSLFTRQPSAATRQTAFGQARKISYAPDPRPSNPNLNNIVPRNARPRFRGASPPPTKTEEELAGMPYVVQRTPYGQLPIYRTYRSGGNKVGVLIKKVRGDQRLLLKELRAVLTLQMEMEFEEKEAAAGDKKKTYVKKEVEGRISPLTGHLEISGNHFDAVRRWCLNQGF